MGKIGNEMLKDLDTKLLAKKLCTCYAFEKELAWFYEVTQSRLYGMAEQLYQDAVVASKERAENNASKLQERIVLFTDIPYDRRVLCEHNPVNIPEIDLNGAVNAEIAEYYLSIYREGLKLYDDLLQFVKDKDVLTFHTILPIIKEYVELEDEFEDIVNRMKTK